MRLRASDICFGRVVSLGQIRQCNDLTDLRFGVVIFFSCWRSNREFVIALNIAYLFLDMGSIWNLILPQRLVKAFDESLRRLTSLQNEAATESAYVAAKQEELETEETRLNGASSAAGGLVQSERMASREAMKDFLSRKHLERSEGC